MKTVLLPALRLLVLLTLFTGLAYPLLITAIARTAFPDQSAGSPVLVDGKLRGSALLAQESSSPRYFFPRPSAGNYSTVASGASNLGPSSRTLREAIDTRRTALLQAHNLPAGTPVPDELLTTSGSGLDPHLSPDAVRFQVKRVAAARGLDPARVLAMVEAMTENRQWGFLGEARVNVLKLNLALDALK
jgi:K+-transporting ATPase ATPase C chain